MPTIAERALAIFAHIGFQGRRENKQHAELESLFDDVSQVLSCTTTITAAQLADLHNTPVELVPAPGTGKLISPVAASGLGYTEDAGSIQACNIEVLWEGVALSPFIDTSDIFASCLEGLGRYSHGVLNSGTNDTDGYAVADIENKALVAASGVDMTIPGAILTSAIGAAGTGYEVDDEITIGDATLTVLTVGGGGEVLTYTVTDAGTTNIIGTGQATTGGTGSGFTIDITELDYSVNPMTLKIKVLYSVFDLT